MKPLCDHSWSSRFDFGFLRDHPTFFLGELPGWENPRSFCWDEELPAELISGWVYIYIYHYISHEETIKKSMIHNEIIYIDNIRQQNSSKFSKYIHEKTWTCTWKSSISGMCGWILLLVSSPKWIIHTVATSVAAPMSSMGKSPSIRWLSQPYFTNIWQK